jgi:hypothetical protein
MQMKPKERTFFPRLQQCWYNASKFRIFPTVRSDWLNSILSFSRTLSPPLATIFPKIVFFLQFSRLLGRVEAILPSEQRHFR